MKLVNVNPKKVAFNSKLLKASPELIKAMTDIFGDELVRLCRSIPPIFTNDSGSLSLVDRHFSFAILVEFGNTSHIPGMLVTEEERKDLVLVNRKFEEMIVNHAATIRSAPKNKSGVSRSQRKELGYVCPFCSLLVKGPKGHKPVEDGTNKGYYRISCFSEQSKEAPCGFHAYLSQDEYALFRARKYPVHLWLKRTESKCPKCGKTLLLRTRFNTKMLFCEDYFRSTKTCKYSSKVSPPVQKECSLAKTASARDDASTLKC
ncbi:MAG: hypothetical protein C4550_02340 [Nitrospiraceae bacterium]|nr:MAG: hypothetical protein C4550_02340 [Nitrospiraceae bacterium]